MTIRRAREQSPLVPRALRLSDGVVAPRDRSCTVGEDFVVSRWRRNRKFEFL